MGKPDGIVLLLSLLSKTLPHGNGVTNSGGAVYNIKQTGLTEHRSLSGRRDDRRSMDDLLRSIWCERGL